MHLKDNFSKIQQSRMFVKYLYKKLNIKTMREITALCTRLNIACEEVSKDFSKEEDIQLKMFVIVYITKLLSNSKKKSINLKEFENLVMKSIDIIAQEAQKVLNSEGSASKTTKESFKN